MFRVARQDGLCEPDRMMTDLAALLVFLFPLAYSPGPGNPYFAALGATGGLRASIPALAGYHVATLLVTFALGLRFLEVLNRAPFVFLVMTWAGSAYMLWLALSFLRARPPADRVTARRAGFVDGAVLLMLNPKAYVIIALMFSQFLNPEVGAFVPRLLAITVLFSLNNLLAFMLWTLLGDTLARLFRGHSAARRLNFAFGVMLAGVAIWMVLR